MKTKILVNPWKISRKQEHFLYSFLPNHQLKIDFLMTALMTVSMSGNRETIMTSLTNWSARKMVRGFICSLVHCNKILIWLKFMSSPAVQSLSSLHWKFVRSCSNERFGRSLSSMYSSPSSCLSLYLYILFFSLSFFRNLLCLFIFPLHSLTSILTFLFFLLILLMLCLDYWTDGRIEDIDIKNGYAFVQFSDERDAEDAVRALDRTDFEGGSIRVEFTRSGGMP